MKRTTKIWLGVGAFVVAGSAAVNTSARAEADASLLDSSALTQPRADHGVHARSAHARSAHDGSFMLAQHSHGGEGGERATKAKRSGGEGGERSSKKAKSKAAKNQGGEGEGGEGEGDEKGGSSKLPPDLDFALKIAQVRGHLLVGDELVKEKQWNAAYPHFRHPTEELYGPIRARLKDYKVPPFEAALRNLANVVKSKKGGDDYDKAFKAVTDALDAAEQAVKGKQTNQDSFIVETALETLKSATGEYQQAIVKGRIAKPVEYQDARGFVWQSERMIDSVAPALEKKDADALKQVRDTFTDLKKTWPAAMPPSTPVKDYGAVLGDVSRIELAAGRLM
jgi:hypothetical protein